MDAFTKESYLRALDLLEQAIGRDPDYGPALALAADCHSGLDVNGWTADPEAARRKSIDFARRALRSAPDDPNVLAVAAATLGYFDEDIDVSVRLIDRCLALNPSSARGGSGALCSGSLPASPKSRSSIFRTFRGPARATAGPIT